MVSKVVVLGGGSAGLLAAMALKRRLPDLRVVVIRSKDIGIIGVGEGSTYAFSAFLHQYLRLASEPFFLEAQPTWKLGLRFDWGDRPRFNYTFGPGLHERLEPRLPKAVGFYCDADADLDDADLYSALMTEGRAFPALPDGSPDLNVAAAYHVENEKFVGFLERAAVVGGVEILDDTVTGVSQGEAGITGLALASGRAEAGDLYVDCSGFGSVLLGKALAEPFESYRSSLFCDRAVVGGWARGPGEPILPYTLCQTMDAGWCWQIEHEHRINRGYVYGSGFISDEAAEREFRAANPKVGPTRIVKFVSGRYRRVWVKNVVAIGNAAGFVEPLEATALAMIGQESRLLAETLADCDRQVRPTQVRMYNEHVGRAWDVIRRFLAVHYKFNTLRDTPFWQHCRAHTDLAGAEPIVEYYRENGPTGMWGPRVLGDGEDQFGMAGYVALLLGQRVPYRRTYEPTAAERDLMRARRERNRQAARRGFTAEQALALIRSPEWDWRRSDLSAGTSGSVRRT